MCIDDIKELAIPGWFYHLGFIKKKDKFNKPPENVPDKSIGNCSRTDNFNHEFQQWSREKEFFLGKLSQQTERRNRLTNK